VVGSEQTMCRSSWRSLRPPSRLCVKRFRFHAKARRRTQRTQRVQCGWFVRNDSNRVRVSMTRLETDIPRPSHARSSSAQYAKVRYALVRLFLLFFWFFLRFLRRKKSRGEHRKKSGSLSPSLFKMVNARSEVDDKQVACSNSKLGQPPRRDMLTGAASYADRPVSILTGSAVERSAVWFTYTLRSPSSAKSSQRAR
jgi:hypothetical protein